MAQASKSAGSPASTAAARAYHHGDLHAALLLAAEQEIVENGVVGFSLRATARRAGVSHAAPAHHFGSAAALLAAVTDEGFLRLAAGIARRLAVAESRPAARLAAAGKGYIAFAQAHPQVFRLMFTRPPGDVRPAGCPPTEAAQQAFGQLQACVVEVLGTEADARQVASGVAAAWGVVHGLASLLADGMAGFLEPFDATVRADIIDSTLERFAEALA